MPWACRCRRDFRNHCCSPPRTPGSTSSAGYSRTHGPVHRREFAHRYGLGRTTADMLLKEVALGGRLLEGEFRPGGTGREWCDSEVLQSIRRASLAKLRKESSRSIRRSRPADHFWQGVVAGASAWMRCSTRSRTSRGRRCRVDLRERDSRGAHRRLQPCRPRRPDRGRRNRLVWRRAAGRARRPHRALPDRSFRAAAA
jgi:hypothetical protein